ncbi:MAG: 4Fe-4S dicluster domain-containing protein [Thermodesulfobacteriota bacterium]
MTRYGMLIDIGKCNGCYNCFLACRDEYAGNDYPPYSQAQPAAGQYWMNVSEKERGTYPKVKVDYLPLPCQHCREASCVTASSPGAVYRRPDGIVLIDPVRSAGQRDIISLCPYRVIYWNPEKNIPQKCTFCAHLLDRGWKVPRCVEACPTGALLFGDLDDPSSEVALALKSSPAEELHPEFGLGPNVLYRGLPKPFIAGEVVLADRPDTCAQGVSLTLVDGGQSRTVQTDCYGDFEFDGLAPRHAYTLRIAHPGYTAWETAVHTGRDVNLGEIVLEKK